MERFSRKFLGAELVQKRGVGKGKCGGEASSCKSEVPDHLPDPWAQSWERKTSGAKGSGGEGNTMKERVGVVEEKLKKMQMQTFYSFASASAGTEGVTIGRRS